LLKINLHNNNRIIQLFELMKMRSNVERIFKPENEKKTEIINY